MCIIMCAYHTWQYRIYMQVPYAKAKFYLLRGVPSARPSGSKFSMGAMEPGNPQANSCKADDDKKKMKGKGDK